MSEDISSCSDLKATTSTTQRPGAATNFPAEIASRSDSNGVGDKETKYVNLGVGLGVGISFLVIIGILTFWFCYRRRKRQAIERASESSSRGDAAFHAHDHGKQPPNYYTQQYSGGYSQGYTPPVELGGVSRSAELPPQEHGGVSQSAELPSREPVAGYYAPSNMIHNSRTTNSYQNHGYATQPVEMPAR